MGYVKQNWTSVAPGGNPPPGAHPNVAQALNILEQGVETVSNIADQAKAKADTAVTVPVGTPSGAVIVTTVGGVEFKSGVIIGTVDPTTGIAPVSFPGVPGTWGWQLIAPTVNNDNNTWTTKVVREFNATTMPTGAPTGNLWPAAIPVTTPTTYLTWGARGNDSLYLPDAFGTGKHGYRIGNDGASFTLPEHSTSPGVGSDVLVMSLRDLLVDSVAPGTDGEGMKILSLYGQDGGGNYVWRCVVALQFVSGAWHWVVWGPQGSGTTLASVPAQQVVRSDNGGLAGPLVLSVVVRGATSKLIIKDGSSVQEVPFDVSGTGPYHLVSIESYEGGIVRGLKTHRLIRVLDGLTDAEVDGTITDAARDAGIA